MPAHKDLNEHKIRLVSLTLNTFRGFRHLDLEFGEKEPINVLIADNGGGKTSILDATAELIRYFLNEGITKQEEKFGTTLKQKDITNGEAASLCNILLELTYKYPAKEIFEVVRDISEYLNDFKLTGTNALLGVRTIREEEDNIEPWMVFLDDQEDGIELPNEIIERLNELTEKDENGNRKLSGDDRFTIANFSNGIWTPNLQLAEKEITKIYYTGQVGIKLDLNKSGDRFIIVEEKNTTYIDGFIDQIERHVAFIEDFNESAKPYNADNTTTILPILAYYGGAAINTNYREVKLGYQAHPFQAYIGALEPDRFDFEDFFEWFNWLRDEPAHIIKLVREKILDALNADQKVYSELRVEKEKLQLNKKPAENVQALPIEISQLSAGEKNLFALVADLIKRAVQLNPVLFEIDFDKEQGSYSNPLEYTYGIVLIDEIDLHLHPKWQRQIVPKLRELFPNVQFVVTTHSPFILRFVGENCVSYANKGGYFKKLKYGNMEGWTIEEVLSEAMGMDEKIYTEPYNDAISKIEKALEEENYSQAKEEYKNIIPTLNPTNTLIKLLRMQVEALKEDRT